MVWRLAFGVWVQQALVLGFGVQGLAFGVWSLGAIGPGLGFRMRDVGWWIRVAFDVRVALCCNMLHCVAACCSLSRDT